MPSRYDSEREGGGADTEKDREREWVSEWPGERDRGYCTLRPKLPLHAVTASESFAEPYPAERKQATLRSHSRVKTAARRHRAIDRGPARASESRALRGHAVATGARPAAIARRPAAIGPWRGQGCS
jgi:hypothetical protein